MTKLEMTEHQKNVSILKVGDVIRWLDDANSNEVIISIIVNNPYDCKSEDEHRVTINGYHWYMDDVVIVRQKDKNE